MLNGLNGIFLCHCGFNANNLSKFMDNTIFNSYLKKLDISGMKISNNEFQCLLERIIWTVENLTILKLNDCFNEIDISIITKLIYKLKILKSFEMNNVILKGTDEKHFMQILTFLPLLKSFKLPKFINSDLKAKLTWKIRSLKLKYTPEEKSENVSLSFKCFIQNIWNLNILNSPLESILNEHLNEIISLNSSFDLELSLQNDYQTIFKISIRKKELSKIILRRINNPYNILNMSNKLTITKLVLSDCNLSSEFINLFCNDIEFFDCLEILNLSYNCFKNSDFKNLLKNLQEKVNKVKVLKIYQQKFTKDIIKEIVSLMKNNKKLLILNSLNTNFLEIEMETDNFVNSEYFNLNALEFFENKFTKTLDTTKPKKIFHNKLKTKNEFLIFEELFENLKQPQVIEMKRINFRNSEKFVFETYKYSQELIPITFDTKINTGSIFFSFLHLIKRISGFILERIQNFGMNCMKNLIQNLEKLKKISWYSSKTQLNIKINLCKYKPILNILRDYLNKRRGK